MERRGQIQHFGAKLACGALLCVLVSSATTEAYDDQRIRSNCAREWPSDFRMQKYCVEQQQEAGLFIDAFVAQYGIESIAGRIGEACQTKWGFDYRMRKYCIEQQAQAVDSISKGLPTDIPKKIAQQIRNACFREWGDDYRMVDYCMKQQAKAWIKLNR